MNVSTLKNGQVLMFWHTDINDANRETFKRIGLNMFFTEKESDRDRGYRAYNFATTIKDYLDHLINRNDINIFQVQNGVMASKVKSYNDLFISD